MYVIFIIKVRLDAYIIYVSRVSNSCGVYSKLHMSLRGNVSHQHLFSFVTIYFSNYFVSALTVKNTKVERNNVHSDQTSNHMMFDGVTHPLGVS